MPQSTLRIVWSLPVRLTHWCLAALVTFDLFNDSGSLLHRYAGYAAAAFVVSRLVYGLLAPSMAARLRIPRPAQCWAHLKSMAAAKPVRHHGHNPLGAAMTLLMWTTLLLLAATGRISRWDAFWGEDWPQDLHSALSLVLQVAIVLHLLGVLASSLVERQNLPRSMISGNKHVDEIPPGR